MTMFKSLLTMGCLLLVLTLGACGGSSTGALDGEACTQASDCQSALCVDLVCCATACDGLCEACNLAGAEGTCSPLPATPAVADDCGGQGSCAGSCDGAGGCEYPAADTACSDGECSGDSLLSYFCNGAGGCEASPSVTDCAPYTCDPSGPSCHGGSCAGLDICAADNVCGTNDICGQPPQIEAVSISPQCLEVSQELQVSATLSGEIDWLRWSFGDGETSDQAQTSHAYTEPGIYDLALNVSGPGGQDEHLAPAGVEVLPAGWQLLYPDRMLGDITDIWRSTDPQVSYAVTSMGLALSYDGAEWQSTDTGAGSLSRIDGVGTAAMAMGYNALVATRDGSHWFDADPENHLPREQNDQMEMVSRDDLLMLSDTQGLLLINRQPITGTASVELWHYDAEAGELDPNQRWFWLLSTGQEPQDTVLTIRMAPDNPARVFAGSYTSDMFTVDALDGNDWRSGVEWKRYDLHPHFAPRRLVPISAQSVWLETYDALIRADWDENLQTFLFTDFSPALLDNASLGALELSQNPDQPPMLLGTIVVNNSPQSNTIQLLTITNPDGPTPEILRSDLTDLKSAQVHALGAYSTDDILYGAQLGYLARYRGLTWQPEIDVLVPGWVGPGTVTPGGKLVFMVSNIHAHMVSYLNGEWSSQDLAPLDPSYRLYPRAILALADDELWAVGDNGLILHSTGTSWELVEHKQDYQDLQSIWGTSADNLWAVGTGNPATILRRQADGSWQRVEQLETLMTSMPSKVFGSGPEDVYVLGRNGEDFWHYDGENWSQVDTGRASLPQVLQGKLLACIDESDPDFSTIRNACTGETHKITQATALANGEVFALVQPLTLEWNTVQCGGQAGACLESYDNERSRFVIHSDGQSFAPMNYHHESPYFLSIHGLDANHVYLNTKVPDPTDPDSVMQEIAQWNGHQWLPLPHQPTDSLSYYQIWGNNPNQLFLNGFFDSFILSLQSCPE